MSQKPIHLTYTIDESEFSINLSKTAGRISGLISTVIDDFDDPKAFEEDIPIPIIRKETDVVCFTQMIQLLEYIASIIDSTEIDVSTSFEDSLYTDVETSFEKIVKNIINIPTSINPTFDMLNKTLVDIIKFDNDFTPKSTLWKLIEILEYFDCKPLVDFCAAIVATKIMENSNIVKAEVTTSTDDHINEKIREKHRYIFGLPDFTSEEERMKEIYKYKIPAI